MSELLAPQPIAYSATSPMPYVVQMTSGFRMSTTPRETEGFIAAAEAMAHAGEQYEVTLVGRWLAPNFVAELRAAISAFRAAISALRDVIDARGQ